MIRRMFRLGVVLIVALLVKPSFAQTYDISWHTIDGGGTMSSTGDGFEIAGTIGQPDASSFAAPMTGGGFEIVGGFWPVANVCYCLADVNRDGNKNGADVQHFVGCILGAGDCACADVNQANGVTVADINVFVADLLANSSCP